ncbi:MAG: ATP-binding protein [Bacteroidota bacterium]
MRFTKLLGFRLFVLILVVMVIGTALFTTLNVQWQSRQHMESTVRSAVRISDIVKRSTHYSMLLNRREDIYQIISTIGTEPGIEAIRIYNKKGEVTFSTDDAEQGKSVDMGAEACTACHSGDQPPVSPNPQELTRIFHSPKGHRILGMITPIRNEAKCSNADCHVHPASQTVLGVLDVMLPLKDVDALLVQSTRVQYASGLALVVVVIAVTGLFIWLVVNIPVRGLTGAVQQVIKGNFDQRIPVRAADEIGVLANSFNLMTDELSRARGENKRWTETLEQRVSEKTEELQRAQHHLIQVEKMASLGKLAATVAHELNNPLEGVLTYAKLLKKRIQPGTLRPDDHAVVQQELTLIADETARCGAIVKNLLLFSRQKVGQMREEDLRSIVERSTMLIEHHLKMHAVKLEKELGEQPVQIQCDAAQIEQALLALEINAVEAMPEGGILTLGLRATPDGNHVEIFIADTGVGIAPQDIPHIFEPFFTTKEEEKGTGLGLAVVYGIVERHAGTIDVRSVLRRGTSFTIKLPVKNIPVREFTKVGIS